MEIIGKKLLTTLLKGFIFLCCTQYTVAQQGGKMIYKFLEIPQSTHAAALGGNSISVIDDDLGLIYHNPALLGKEMDEMFSLDYINYIGDINIGSATYAKSTKRLGTFGFGIHYLNYGSFKETTEQNQVIGNSKAQDLAFNLFYAYDLSEFWRGGVSTKFIYSHYGSYNSFGIAVDLGLSYYNPYHEYSFAVVIKNLGSQIKRYNEHYEQMPWDIQLGITKQLAHAPFKFSITLQRLREWDFSTRNETIDPTKSKDSFLALCLKHVVLGIDFVPGKNFYASIGYDYYRRTELALEEKAGFTGFSGGAGLRVKNYRIGFAVAQYHVSGLSYHFNIAKKL